MPQSMRAASPQLRVVWCFLDLRGSMKSRIALSVAGTAIGMRCFSHRVIGVSMPKKSVERPGIIQRSTVVPNAITTLISPADHGC